MKHFSKMVAGLGILLIFSLLVISPVTAQSNENPTNDPEYKDPNTALIYAFVLSGGGHFYAGESKKGATLLGITYGSIIAGYALGEMFPKKTDIGFGITVEEYNSTFLWIGVLAAGGAYIYSLADAKNAARRANERNGLTQKIQIAPSLLTTKINRKGYGITLKYNF